MIIDAHHHLWEDHDWLAGLPGIRRPYRVADLRAVTPADRTVLVQTVPTMAETEAFLATAANTELIAGVVGWVDLRAPDVAGHLAELGDTALVGIRHQAQDEPDPRWLVRPDVVRGIKAVAKAGLAYDILVRPPQYQAAVELAAAVPEATFVLDHAGKPPIATGELEPWATFLTKLAAHPNVYCKLSGLITEADWTRWTIADLRPYAAHVLAAFTPDRVMFGSDWPVCELAGTYDQVYGAARTLTADLSPAERAEVFGGTAARAYPALTAT